MTSRARAVAAALLGCALIAPAQPAGAGGVTVTFVKGTLTVRTTAKSEEIKIQPAGESVRILIDGNRADIPPEADTKVAAVRLISGGGKDVFLFEAVRGELPKVVALGQSGKDTYVVDGDMTGVLKIIDGDGAGTLDLSRSTVPVKVNLGLGPGVTQRVTPDLNMRLAGSFKFVTTGSGDDRLIASKDKDRLTGGLGDDTFEFRPSFGRDSVIDFGDGADTLDLANGLSVRTGFGTKVLTVWDGVDDHGTITATNGHVWQPTDVS